MATILVTGATGFIGKSLVPHLQTLGHQVRCAVWKKKLDLEAEQIEINKIENQVDWHEALTNIDIVIHLAAKVHVLNKKESQSVEIFCKINSEATKQFAKAAARAGVKRFIFLSSVKVNGEYTTLQRSFTENCQPQPQDPYAKSKLLAEDYLWQISRETGLEVVIFRPPLVYGPEVKANFLRLLSLVAKRWPLPFAKVDNQRHFIFIDNLISAISAALTHPQAANQLFMVADDESWSLADLMRFMAAEMQIRLPLFAMPVNSLVFLFNLLGLNRVNTRLFKSLRVDNKKIKLELAWQPPIKSADGLRKTVQWYQHEIHR